MHLYLQPETVLSQSPFRIRLLVHINIFFFTMTATITPHDIDLPFLPSHLSFKHVHTHRQIDARMHIMSRNTIYLLTVTHCDANLQYMILLHGEIHLASETYWSRCNSSSICLWSKRLTVAVRVYILFW